jgi:hypothetical protein
MDGMLYAGAKLRSAGIILSFDSKHGPLSYPCDKYSKWQANLRAIALSLEALRAVDRYGVTRRAEQYKGWAKLGGPAAPVAFPTTHDAALFIAQHSTGPRSLPGDILQSADHFRAQYREAAARLHPDRNGGDESAFKRLQQAKEILEKHHAI